MKNEKKDVTPKKNKRHFMYFVLDADKKEHPMPTDAADSILKRILSFFFDHSNMRRDSNG